MNILGIEFLNPWWFLLLLPLGFIIWKYYFRKREDPSFMAPGPVDSEQYISWRSRLSKWLLPMLLCSIFLAILAMANPQKTFEEQVVKTDGLDIFLALDLSSSMKAQDFRPNRLEVSKELAIDFCMKREHDRIGLVVFANEAFTYVPLTTDKELISERLSEADVGLLTDGTAIGMGLGTAVNRIKSTEANSKVIILLTDGVNRSGIVSPMTAAKLAAKLGIRVYTIGIGTKGNAKKPIGKRRDGSYIYRMQKVNINEDLLRDIAHETGGEYFRAQNREDMAGIYEKIDRLETTPIELNVYERTAELYRYFLLPSLVLFILYIICNFGILNVLKL